MSLIALATIPRFVSLSVPRAMLAVDTPLIVRAAAANALGVAVMVDPITVVSFTFAVTPLNSETRLMAATFAMALAATTEALATETLPSST